MTGRRRSRRGAAKSKRRSKAKNYRPLRAVRRGAARSSADLPVKATRKQVEAQNRRATARIDTTNRTAQKRLGIS